VRSCSAQKYLFELGGGSRASRAVLPKYFLSHRCCRSRPDDPIGTKIGLMTHCSHRPSRMPQPQAARTTRAKYKTNPSGTLQDLHQNYKTNPRPRPSACGAKLQNEPRTSPPARATKPPVPQMTASLSPPGAGATGLPALSAAANARQLAEQNYKTNPGSPPRPLALIHGRLPSPPSPARPRPPRPPAPRGSCAGRLLPAGRNGSGGNIGILVGSRTCSLLIDGSSGGEARLRGLGICRWLRANRTAQASCRKLQWIAAQEGTQLYTRPLPDFGVRRESLKSDAGAVRLIELLFRPHQKTFFIISVLGVLDLQ